MDPFSPASSDVDLSIDLDSSVLTQVQRAIHRFAVASQQEAEIDEDEDPLPSLNPALPTKELSLEEKKHEYECQIRSLENEIRLLEDELTRRDLPLEDIKDDQLEQAMFSVAQCGVEGGAVLEPHSSPASDSPSMNEEDEQLEAMRSQVRFSGAFNGVKFDNISWEITEKDDCGLFRQHTHSGSCRGYTFQVQFIVREEKMPYEGEGGIERAKVIALRPQVDPSLRSEMQVFLKRVSSDCDLMNFYQTFVKCCHCVHERRSTLKRMKSRYGDRVSLSGGVDGTRMRFVFDNGCCLHFNWTISVSDHGLVDHSISLQTKSSASASEDQREGLSSLPHLLQKITSLKGHSQGLVKFLSLLTDPASHIAAET